MNIRLFSGNSCVEFADSIWERKMLVLITYDVNTETPAGRNRLRKVAKQCTIMDRESRIPYLSVIWMLQNAGRSKLF